jgi:hypothetical protein
MNTKKAKKGEHANDCLNRRILRAGLLLRPSCRDLCEAGPHTSKANKGFRERPPDCAGIRTDLRPQILGRFVIPQLASFSVPRSIPRSLFGCQRRCNILRSSSIRSIARRVKRRICIRIVRFCRSMKLVETLAEKIGTTRSRVSFFMNRFGVGIEGYAHSNSRTPRRLSRGAASLHCLSPTELLRKHAASHLLVSVDFCAESRCPAMGSSWRCPVEGRSGFGFPVKG